MVIRCKTGSPGHPGREDGALGTQKGQRGCHRKQRRVESCLSGAQSSLQVAVAVTHTQAKGGPEMALPP